jgi:hypothetical protein
MQYPPPPPPYVAAQPSAVATIIPYKNPKALTAYYCGVFAIIPCLALILGPIAFFFGLSGLKAANANPEAKGKVHAWIGIVMGALTFLANAIVIGLILLPAILR